MLKVRSVLPWTSITRIASKDVIRGPENANAPDVIRASRRAVLGSIVSAPFATVLVAEVSAAALPCAAAGNLVLRRTREGRQLSRIRYYNAESFFAPIERDFPFRQSDQLYQIGITMQLALSSHLLDVGFDDAWCARNIGLYVNKSLEHANATGLGHDCPELKQLADALSPYGRLRNADTSGASIPFPFSNAQMRRLTRGLLEGVREITGHTRPLRWRGAL